MNQRLNDERSSQNAVTHSSSLDYQINTVRDLGARIKSIREGEGWTFPDAAAWLGVGPRFLFDLERGKRSVQMDMALQVAGKLGIRLFMSPPSLRFDLSTGQPPQEAELKAPEGHPAPRAWLALRYAALSMARESGIEVVATVAVKPRTSLFDPVVRIINEPVRSGLRIGTLSEWSKASQIPLVTARGKGPGISIKEDTGGPSFAQILTIARAHARNPLKAVQILVRWLVFSVMIADSETDADCIRVFWSDSQPALFDLAPFVRTMCAANLVTERPLSGLRVGTFEGDGFLRADQWVRFAKEVADIHPKLIFQLMKEMSVRVPGLLDAALINLTGQPPTARPVIEAIKEVRGRAERMNELMLTAKRQVSGLTTKTQPKTKPLPIKFVLEKPRRHLNMAIDSD